MRTFKITRNLSVTCEWVKTRMAFKHTAILHRDGYSDASTKICYCNRTWERYEYESVLEKLFGQVESSLSKYERSRFKLVIKNGGDAEMKRFNQELKTVAMVASLGSLFSNDRKEANDWKTRMIKAGLEGKGLIMPDDWDSLSEEEKERRLNSLIAFMKEEVKS